MKRSRTSESDASRASLTYLVACSRYLPILAPTKKHFARFWLLFPKPLIVQFCLRIRSVHRPSETNMVNGDNGAERALVGRKQGNESAGLLLGTPDAECEAGAWGPRQPSSVSGDGGAVSRKRKHAPH